MESWRKVYAVYHVVQMFHQYIYHTRTILKSDHLPLKGFLNGKIKNKRCGTWALYVQEHILTFQHRQGRANKAADALSRLLHNPEMTTKQLITFFFSKRE